MSALSFNASACAPPGRSAHSFAVSDATQTQGLFFLLLQILLLLLSPICLPLSSRPLGPFMCIHTTFQIPGRYSSSSHRLTIDWQSRCSFVRPTRLFPQSFSLSFETWRIGMFLKGRTCRLLIVPPHTKKKLQSSVVPVDWWNTWRCCTMEKLATTRTVALSYLKASNLT